MDQLRTYPLLSALLERRSRRFAKGMALKSGPLAYRSTQPPQPLSLEEEAALTFAACGITGYALAELPYATDPIDKAGGGNIMIRFIGRTVASGHALHYVIVFVINDDGVWMVKRPQDFPSSEIPGLIEDARAGRFVDLYERSRIRIADRRLDVPRREPFVPSFNKWSANVPGTTYFLPVNEFSADYINVLLAAFSEEFGYFIVDERRGFRPAGIGAFARSRGGHLSDDPRDGLVATIGFFETWLYEFAAIEQGGILQNLGLMTQALGLGGFPHFAAHPFSWFTALGFRLDPLPFSRTIGAGPLTKGLLKLLGKDVPVPTAVGLEQAGSVLIRPYCPPYYRTMEEAVLSFVESKYAPGSGTFRDGGVATGWKDGSAIQAGIPRYSDRAIAATIAYCEYVYRRYGRFPAYSGPFRTILAYQAHHLDPAFYDRYYRPGALSETQQEHECRWHAGR
ncbi:hypothetical protein [Candidatus Nitrospira bockiana]